jgi:hypothetical protein
MNPIFPCPRCGATINDRFMGERLLLLVPMGTRYAVVCNYCSLVGESKDTTEEAVESWNKLPERGTARCVVVEEDKP